MKMEQCDYFILVLQGMYTETWVSQYVLYKPSNCMLELLTFLFSLVIAVGLKEVYLVPVKRGTAGLVPYLWGNPGKLYQQGYV